MGQRWVRRLVSDGLHGNTCVGAFLEMGYARRVVFWSGKFYILWLAHVLLLSAKIIAV